MIWNFNCKTPLSTFPSKSCSCGFLIIIVRSDICWSGSTLSLISIDLALEALLWLLLSYDLQCLNPTLMFGLCCSSPSTLRSELWPWSLCLNTLVVEHRSFRKDQESIPHITSELWHAERMVRSRVEKATLNYIQICPPHLPQHSRLHNSIYVTPVQHNCNSSGHFTPHPLISQFHGTALASIFQVP